jgi:hypothetical protein
MQRPAGLAYHAIHLPCTESRMNRFQRWWLPLFLVAVVAACNKPASDASAAAPAAGTASTGPAAAEPSATQASAPAETGFVLTMDKVDAYYATIGKVSELTRKDPSLAEGDPLAMEDSESLDAYVARTEADPKARQLVTSGGMSVREFAQTNAAMLEGMMAAGMMESQGITKVPEGINPQYVEFAQEHKAELQAKVDALQKQYGG